MVRWRVVAGACLLLGCAPLLASVASAGVCEKMDRTYCVAGKSTPADWHWKIDSAENTVDAVAAGLSAGDPPEDIVAAMVADVGANGATAVVSSPATCFVVTSCAELEINSVVVPTVTPISFNPLIVQILPEPSSTSLLVAGVLAVGGLCRRRSRSAGRTGAATRG
jgi:hypothetical protein